jgi:N-acetylneuraminic acid mutarotase
MRKQLQVFITALLVLASFNMYAQEWKQRSNFGGTNRKDATGFAIGNKGYIGNGDDGIKKEDLWEYDKATDTWSQKANVPGGTRDKACGFNVGSKGYVVTGVDLSGTYMNDCHEYDPGNK